VSEEEAARRIAIMANAGAALSATLSEVGEQRAGGYFQHKPEFKYVLRSTEAAGKGPQRRRVTVVGAKRSHELDVEILPGARRNFRAIRSLLDSQGQRLARAIPGVQGLGYDAVHDRILVDVLVAEGRPFDVEAAKRDLSKIAGMSVDIRSSTAPLELDVVRGGGSMLNPQGTGCTVGFSASRKGVPGVVSAGHCGRDEVKYVGQDGSTHKLSGHVIPVTLDYDLLWAATDGEVTGQFYPTSGTTYRKVTGTRFQDSTNESGWFSDGSYVCHYGKTTGQSCGEVTSTSYRPVNEGSCTGTGVCNSTWVRLEGPDLACGNGDSGGPVFAYETAFGVWNGASKTGTAKGQCNYAYYSSVDWIQRGLGADIILEK
jgi:hypothetical protein